MSDLTLLSKISNEAINDNLKLRFEHGEIYVRQCDTAGGWALSRAEGQALTGVLNRRTLAMCWSQSIRSKTVSGHQLEIPGYPNPEAP